MSSATSMWTGWIIWERRAYGTVRYKSFKNPGQDAPIISAGCGVIDICGKLRPEVQWNRLVWGLDHTPGIGVEPYTHAGETGSESMWRDTDAVASWSWAGCEGKKPRSRSTLTAKRRNSLSTGIPMAEKRRRNARPSLNALSMSVHHRNQLRWRGKRTEDRTSMKTAAGPAELRVVADRSTLQAKTQDLAYISIDLTGADGITNLLRILRSRWRLPVPGRCWPLVLHVLTWGKTFSPIPTRPTTARHWPWSAAAMPPERLRSR